VGDAKDGRFAGAESWNGGFERLDSASFSGCTGTEVCGDVLRRFGAEVSMELEIGLQATDPWS
jgi:hypothetical protein